MSETSPHTPFEHALNEYVDGELAFDAQAELFAHLATCEACRETLDVVMGFRRMSRQEAIVVPASVDDAFFKRLAEVRTNGDRHDRAGDRAPLWHMERPVTVRTAVLLAVIVFVVGALLPTQPAPAAGAAFATGEDEHVEFGPDGLDGTESAVYIFYPGLTIEADKADLFAETRF